MRHKIPEDEIWMRQDVYEDPKRRERILQGHEKYELTLMETKGLTYKQAHRRAQLHEKFYLLERDIDNLEKNLKIKHHELVTIEEPKAYKPKKKKATKKTDEEKETGQTEPTS